MEGETGWRRDGGLYESDGDTWQDWSNGARSIRPVPLAVERVVTAEAVARLSAEKERAAAVLADWVALDDEWNESRMRQDDYDRRYAAIFTEAQTVIDEVRKGVIT